MIEFALCSIAYPQKKNFANIATSMSRWRRGWAAMYDKGSGELTYYTGTSCHTFGLSMQLNLPIHHIRVIAPIKEEQFLLSRVGFETVLVSP